MSRPGFWVTCQLKAPHLCSEERALFLKRGSLIPRTWQDPGPTRCGAAWRGSVDTYRAGGRGQGGARTPPPPWEPPRPAHRPLPLQGDPCAPYPTLGLRGRRNTGASRPLSGAWRLVSGEGPGQGGGSARPVGPQGQNDLLWLKLS